MVGRSLRPRRNSIDYTGNLATAATPKWLKSSGTDSQEESQRSASETDKPTEKENESPPNGSRSSKRISSRQQNEELGKEKQGASQKNTDIQAGRKQSKKGPKTSYLAEHGSGTDSEATHSANEEGSRSKRGKLVVPVRQAKQEKAPKISKNSSHSTKEQESTESRKADTQPAPKRLSRFGTQQDAATLANDNTAADTELEQPSGAQQEEQPPAKKQRSSRNGQSGKSGDAPASEKAGTEAMKEQEQLQASAARTRSKKRSASAAPAQEAVPPRENAVDSRLPGNVTDSLGLDTRAMENFLKLQAEYTEVCTKYTELKTRKMLDVETAVEQIRSQEEARSQKAVQLAAHWEAEAQRQAAIAQHGDVAALQKELEALKGHFLQKEHQLLECEAKILEKEEDLIEVKHRMGELVRLVENLQDSNEPEQSTQEEVGGSLSAARPPQLKESVGKGLSQPGVSGRASTEARSSMPADREEARVASSAAEESSKQQGDVEPASLRSSPLSSQAAGMAVQRSVEPAGISLVPYSAGASGLLRAAPTRFAREAAAKVGQLSTAGGVERQLSFTPFPAAEGDSAALGAAQQGKASSGEEARRNAARSAEEAFKFLTSLTVSESSGESGFCYCHSPTGFRFQILEEEEEEDGSEIDDEEFAGAMTFRPLTLGSAAELLPDFLKDELKFAPGMRLKLLSSILKSLGNAA